MKTNLIKFEKDLEALIKEGEKLSEILRQGKDEYLLDFRKSYEAWYSEALYLIQTIIPNREKDFQEYYNSKKDDCLKKAITYTPPKSEGIKSITDEIPASRIDIASSLFENQLGIVKSVQRWFESSLFDIKQLLQFDLFDNELRAANELIKKGFLRGAGAMSGVVLEAHLKQVCSKHHIIISKKHPVINDLNNLLKTQKVIELDIFRFIQRLGDLRNLCDHDKENEPTKGKVKELIDGTEKIIKTVF